MDMRQDGQVSDGKLVISLNEIRLLGLKMGYIIILQSFICFDIIPHVGVQKNVLK